MQGIVAVGAGLGLSMLFLVLACIIDSVWWPLFNVFFFALSLIPFAFGSHESTGIWGSLGDFLEAIFAFSTFAYPMVLFRVDELYAVGLTFVFLSNIIAGGTLYMLHKIANETSIW